MKLCNAPARGAPAKPELQICNRLHSVTVSVNYFLLLQLAGSNTASSDINTLQTLTLSLLAVCKSSCFVPPADMANPGTVDGLFGPFRPGGPFGSSDPDRYVFTVCSLRAVSSSLRFNIQ